jgi:hypothetical protein
VISQLQSQHEYKTATGMRQTPGQNKQHTKNKLNQFRLFTFKRRFLKISVDLQTALAAEAHLAEGTVAGGAIEHGKVKDVPSTNTNADCFRERRALPIAVGDFTVCSLYFMFRTFSDFGCKSGQVYAPDTS